MTICASVKVRDGLVLATDSMSQIHGRDETGRVGVIKTYSNARKLFQISNLSMGVMSYGIGNIGNRSIQGFIRDFSPAVSSITVPASSTAVREVTASLFRFIRSAYDSEYGSLRSEEQPELGFFVAGYSAGRAFAEEWEFLIPRDSEPGAVRSETAFGASWRGIEVTFARLYAGFDPRIEQQLRAAGLWNYQIERIMKAFPAQFVLDGMPVQDAVNFATYIIKTTIGLSTFEAGPPSCGGPLQVATILPESGFEWLMNPPLAVQEL